ncbi:MAG: hypothetical protein KGZ30_04260 [Anaplasmataceae bacterium]|nr:hypothetical protein [Anaplasmataceae bacterium]
MTFRWWGVLVVSFTTSLSFWEVGLAEEVAPSRQQLEAALPTDSIERWLLDLPANDNCPNYQVILPAVLDPMLGWIHLQLPSFLQGFDPRLPPILVRSLPSWCERREEDAKEELTHALTGMVARGIAQNSLDWIGERLPQGLTLNVDIDIPESIAVKVKYEF